MAARRLHNLIYITIANCCLFLIVSAVSLGTNQWFRGRTNVEVVDGVEIKATVSYGLFSGKKIQTSTTTTQHNLKIVCQGSKGCMFSCGVTGENRKQDFDDLYNGRVADQVQDYLLCTKSSESRESSPRVNVTADNKQGGNPERKKPVFINFGLYITTIGFIVLGMLFSVVSGVLALYNTYRTPIQPILGVSGLYLWNGLAAFFVLFAMLMWVIQFFTRLRKNAAISDTLSGILDSSGLGGLGVSFWILLLPLCFAIANIGILKFRKWKIVKMEEKNVRVMTEKLESGDILLF